MSDPDHPEHGAFDPEAGARERRLARAVADFLDLQADEQPMNVEAFCRQYPGIEAEIRREIGALVHIDSLLGETMPPLTEPLPAAAVPAGLSGHRILRLIGAGGMGRVFLARDERLGRDVAIKELQPRLAADPGLRARFMEEARSLARIRHPNIVGIYGLGPEGETPHFVMEYVAGAPLTEACRPLNVRQKAELMRKVALAVEHLHQHGIIHRDLKPGNILVGADLEPKLLDFGLARRESPDPRSLTRPGEVLGTPEYFSPEQARTRPSADARSDVFSLGVILFEVLTGETPFRADSLSEQLRRVCEEDPVLPRRLNPEVPGPLQNICMQALEKEPTSRYRSAREMARDLERFLAGEPVLANPGSYARLMAGKIDQHLRELKGWQTDRILSWYEFDAFRRLYERLVEREDAWILETRRLSLPQVTLYLGAWVLAVAAMLLLFFRHPDLVGSRAVLVVSGAAVPMAWIGLRLWGEKHQRIAVAYLLAFCLLLPTTLLVAMKEWGLLSHFSQGKESLEFFALFNTFREPGMQGKTVFRGPTNAQLWWALTLSFPAYFGLRRFTRSSVFSLVFSFMGALLCATTLLRWGMLEWIEMDQGRVYFRLLPFALLFFLAAAAIERIPSPQDSRYFYPVAIVFTFISLSGLAAFHEPYARWLEATFPRSRGQLEYFFIANAGIYLGLQSLCERFGSPQMRSAAKAFRFVIPGHVLTSLLLLGLAATQRWEEAVGRADMRAEARFFEIALPVAACLFVMGSVPKQMKNFLVTGLLFLAIGLGRLQQGLFREQSLWPISLLGAGLALMLLAAHYTPVKLVLRRLLRRGGR